MKRLGLERAAEVGFGSNGMGESKLKGKFPDIRIETILIKTSGDRFLEASVQPIGGKGIFTKEVEDALLRQADLMVIAGTVSK